MIPVASFAQVTPAASFTPLDDTPSIKLGVTLNTGLHVSGLTANQGRGRQHLPASQRRLRQHRRHDQTSITARDIHSKGPSFWVNPKKPYKNGSSVELLFRYDHLSPDVSTDQARPRTIVGLAYWFPHSGNLQTTLMLDYDGQTFKNFLTAQPSQKKIAIHGQVIF
jgi:hypothetical protein